MSQGGAAEMSDLAAMAAGFSEALRRAGVMVTTEQAGRFARAVHVTSPLGRTELYWTARATLVTGHDQIPAFDAVFGQVFGGLVDGAEFRGDERASPFPSSRPPDAPRRTSPPGREPPGPGRSFGSPLPAAAATPPEPAAQDVSIGLASREERLAHRDFAELGAHDLAELQRLLRNIRLALPLRPGRRSRRHRRGDELDMRATLRHIHRSAGDPRRVVRRSRRRVPRRLVMICDISGSMEPYALAYVHFLHAAASVPGSSRAEVFTFATRLTRLTRALSDRDVTKALRHAASAAPDWQGGTRIGEAVKSFLDSYGRRGVARGAVVVVMSDGWERDDPGMLGEQMARLRRLAYRIIWVNPRSADPRYEPLTAGMAAALPHCDLLVSGHSVAALEHLATAIAGSR
ncbi:MAG TPA: VWA domain-containing protein [Acidimicrobiales bacterium]|nr:VWA domain-containing protein [Acidimicrobiales bacterium]